MYSILKPFIFSLDPETAHDLAINSLKFNVLPKNIFQVEGEESLEIDLFNEKLPNPIGLAAGFDKSAEVYNSLFKLGFGFVEIIRIFQNYIASIGPVNLNLLIFTPVVLSIFFCHFLVLHPPSFYNTPLPRTQHNIVTSNGLLISRLINSRFHLYFNCFDLAVAVFAIEETFAEILRRICSDEFFDASVFDDLKFDVLVIHD